MKIADLVYQAKILRPHKAIVEPDFKSKTVLASSQWVFVEMFLKRNANKEALFYWK